MPSFRPHKSPKLSHLDDDDSILREGGFADSSAYAIQKPLATCFVSDVKSSNRFVSVLRSIDLFVAKALPPFTSSSLSISDDNLYVDPGCLALSDAFVPRIDDQSRLRAFQYFLFNRLVTKV